MVSSKDITELRRRITKDNCTFTRMCGCYVNADKEKITKIEETFLNLDDEEFYKYLDIAKAIFSKKIGEKMLQLDFTEDEKVIGGVQQALLAIRENRLKDETLLDRLYDKIIQDYSYVGNYLILVYHDAYDVMKVTKNNEKLDESEEVYEYIICAVCPVGLTPPGLEYDEEENKIKPRERDWVVGKPRVGFIYPAFDNRETEEDELMYFTDDSKKPDHTFMEIGLGCEPVRTASEKKEAFEDIVFNATQSEELTDDYLMAINERMNVMQQQWTDGDKKLALNADEMKSLYLKCEIPTEYASKMARSYDEEFRTEWPELEILIDSKMLKYAEAKHRREARNKMMQDAINIIEGHYGEEIELTRQMKEEIGRSR